MVVDGCVGVVCACVCVCVCACVCVCVCECVLTSFIRRFGSGDMTVQLEKSMRFPDKFPLNRPCFPLRRCTNPRVDFLACLGGKGGEGVYEEDREGRVEEEKRSG